MDSKDAKVVDEQVTNTNLFSHHVSAVAGGLPVQVERDSLDYQTKPLSDKPSRKAYVFNHQYFDGEGERKGTQVDKEALAKVLPGLGFQFKCFDDLSVKGIREKICELSDDEQVDYTNDDCLMVVVLTHGWDGGILYAKDGPYMASELWNPFTPDKCKTLAGKPKLFIIQACRGGKLDDGVQVKCDSPKLLDNGGPKKYVLPTRADFMYVYSNIPGFVSWRNSVKGSYFIQAICDVLSEHGKTEDFLSMMTLVVQKVATSEPRDETGKSYAQTACIVTQLIRRVYFDPKNK